MKTFIHTPIKLPTLKSETRDDGSRFYTTPHLGRVYPSVTTVLAEHTKSGINQWKARVGAAEAERVGKFAAAQGTRFHLLAERYLNNTPLTDADTISLFDADLFHTAQPELNKIDNILAQEATLYSNHLRMAGRVDCVASYEGRRNVIDFKSSKREKLAEHVQHHLMQATAYAIMFEEITEIPVQHLTILIAVEDGFMQVFRGKRDDYVKSLLHYRDLYEETHGITTQ